MEPRTILCSLLYATGAAFADSAPIAVIDRCDCADCKGHYQLLMAVSPRQCQAECAADAECVSFMAQYPNVDEGSCWLFSFAVQARAYNAALDRTGIFGALRNTYTCGLKTGLSQSYLEHLLSKQQANFRPPRFCSEL